MALELISIHIPKTAGTSLLHAYYDVYGKSNVVHLLRKDVKGQERKLSQYINKDTKVIHGHFYFSEIDQELLDNKNIRIIVFLREPIARLVSNYHHFIKTTRQKFPGSIQWFRQFESLEKYASREETKNVICKYLKPFNWDRIEFIGFQEAYGEELRRLAGILKWENVPHFELNTHIEKKQLQDELSMKLKEWNKDDIELFNNLYKIRKISL